MNNAELLFKDKALVKGGLILFAKHDAIEFVKQCQKEGIRVLGVDGFKIIGEKIQPSLDNSIDLSSSQDITSYDRAVDFIKSTGDEFYFEITSDD